MTTLKVRRIGNSLGAILPYEVLQRLRVGEDDELFVIEDSDGVRLTPYNPDFEQAFATFEEGRKRYRNTLRKLVE
ncbi:MAG TPA: AbrB/MazE/SpoVT family DNA-binding domain-containing protein [Candidatus Hydrogenedentes bacterium]|nr:AbrB/MazE/SpoVT family DNA-binding domain-containing protein [Candidatus Hydrogenedentota bacterium]